MNNKLVTSGSKQVLDNMKYKIARELNVNLRPDTSARQNGSVGGEMTKRLVELGKSHMSK